jgi:hypothetical protein
MSKHPKTAKKATRDRHRRSLPGGARRHAFREAEAARLGITVTEIRQQEKARWRAARGERKNSSPQSPPNSPPAAIPEPVAIPPLPPPAPRGGRRYHPDQDAADPEAGLRRFLANTVRVRGRQS